MAGTSVHRTGSATTELVAHSDGRMVLTHRHEPNPHSDGGAYMPSSHLYLSNTSRPDEVHANVVDDPRCDPRNAQVELADSSMSSVRTQTDVGDSMARLFAPAEDTVCF